MEYPIGSFVQIDRSRRKNGVGNSFADLHRGEEHLADAGTGGVGEPVDAGQSDPDEGLVGAGRRERAVDAVDAVAVEVEGPHRPPIRPPGRRPDR